MIYVRLVRLEQGNQRFAGEVHGSREVAELTLLCHAVRAPQTVDATSGNAPKTPQSREVSEEARLSRGARVVQVLRHKTISVLIALVRPRRLWV